MGGGGKTATQQTTQTSTPWASQIAPLERGFDLAQAWINNNPWEGAGRVSGETDQGLTELAGWGGRANVGAARDLTRDVAQGNWLPNSYVDANAVDGLRSMAGAGTYGSADAQAGLRDMAGRPGYGDGQGTDYLRGLVANGAIDPQAQGLLRQVAGGEFLATGNPYRQAVIDNTIAGARPSVDAAFAGSGRLGSGAHAAAFADTALRTSDSINYRDYEAERGRQDQAIQGLLNVGFQDAGVRSGAAGALEAGARADAGTRIGLLSGLDTMSRNDSATRAGLLNNINAAAGTFAQGQMATTQARLAAAMQSAGLETQDIQSLLAAGQGRDAALAADRGAVPDAIARYMQMIGGNYGQTSVGTAPAASNTGAMLGAGASVIGSGVGLLTGSKWGSGLLDRIF